MILAIFRLRPGSQQQQQQHGRDGRKLKAGKRILFVIRLIEVGGQSVTLTNWVEIAVLVIIAVLAVRFFQKRT
jgi:hypothetical protein